MAYIDEFINKEIQNNKINVLYANSVSNFTILIYNKIEELLKLLEEKKISENEFNEKIYNLVSKNIELLDKKVVSTAFTIIQKESSATFKIFSQYLLATAAKEVVSDIKKHLQEDLLSKNPFFTIEFTKYKTQMQERILTNINDVVINKKTYKDAVAQMGTIKDLNKNQLNTISRSMFRSILTDSTLASYKELDIKKVRVVVIEDSRTTSVCKKLAGKVFDINDCPTFPLHYNCRSSLLPIFDDDEKYKNKKVYSFYSFYKDNQDDTDLKRLKYVIR